MSIQNNSSTFKYLLRGIKTGEITDNWTITKDGNIRMVINSNTIICSYNQVEILINDKWRKFSDFRKELISTLLG